MEREEKGNTSMTVGVVLTVAVAILLLVAMIPAMMPPAQEGGGEVGPSAYVTALDYTDDRNVTLKQGDTALATITLSNDAVFGNNHDVMIIFESHGYARIGANADSLIVGEQYDIGMDYFVFEVHNPEEFSETAVFTEDPDYPDNTPLMTYTMSPTAPANTPDIYTLVWEAMFLNQSYNPGFDPEYPPGGGSSGGVDTNTVLIGAIISLLFISIALVAVRSFRA